MGEMNKKDIKVGSRFGRLTTIGPTFVDGKVRKVPCRCTCGVEKVLRVDHLKDGSTSSCGCLCAESSRARAMKHGEWTTKLWGHWSAMRRRCNTESTGNYYLYGGRGITVCEEWKDYLAFRAWALANGYADDLSLDRVDVNGDYCPDNCRWVDRKRQARNRRNTIFVEYEGARVPLADLSERFGIDPDLVYARVVNCGWDVHEALTVKKGGPRHDH